MIKGQDIHFSQFYNSPLNINPALTGVFKEDVRFIGNYRRQWQSVPVPYLTFSGAFDMKFEHRKLPNGFFAGGFLINYDKTGDPELSTTNLTLSGSYTHRLTDNNLLTLGVQFGSGQRALKLGQLSFGNQFNGDTYVPSADPRENLTDESIFYTDLSTGLNWRVQDGNGRFKMDLGFGLFHLTQPKVNFSNEATATLSRRMSIYLLATYQIQPKMDVLFMAMNQKQGAYTELIGGGALRYRLNQQRGKELAVQFGVNYRLIGKKDAIIPTVEILYTAWKLGFSYDVNLSEFQLATDKNGGPELSLIYTITKVKPVKATKSCPIF